MQLLACFGWADSRDGVGPSIAGRGSLPELLRHDPEYP